MHFEDEVHQGAFQVLGYILLKRARKTSPQAFIRTVARYESNTMSTVYLKMIALESEN